MIILAVYVLFILLLYQDDSVKTRKKPKYHAMGVSPFADWYLFSFKTLCNATCENKIHIICKEAFEKKSFLLLNLMKYIF